MSDKLGAILRETVGYDTQLSPQEEAAFRKWAGGRVSDTEDYDLRGAWKADAHASPNGHLPDTYKKPNHPTFSDESQYSTPQQSGGHWVPTGRRLPNGEPEYVFWAAPINMRTQGMAGLSDYFKQVEPGNSVVFPLNYRLPKR